MIKKTITIILGIIIVFSLTACVNTIETHEIRLDLEGKGLSLIAEVDTLAECEEFIALCSGSSEITEFVSVIAKGNYTQPKAVFMIENLDELVFKNMAQDVSLPSEIEKMVKGRFAPVLPYQINAMNGAMAVAATSVLSHGDNFICEGLDNTVTYLYMFDSSYSFMVTFTPNDENIVNASVSVVMSEDLPKCTTEDEVVEYFENALNFEDVSVVMTTEEKE